jgi:regulator of replication initiation timing
VSTPALGADHLLVLSLSPTGESVIQNRQAAEARRRPEDLTVSIAASCERYAAIERRAVRFRAAWMRGEKTLATYQWESGSGKPERELDGTVQSFLVDQQANNRELTKLMIESFELSQASWKAQVVMLSEQNADLHKENAELRTRLRKLDDAQTDLAFEQMRAELEQKGRTFDLVEKRLLPIAQAVAMRHLQESSAAPAPAIGVGQDNKHSNAEKPSA